MDEYRTTLLGRALADVLQELEMEGTLEMEESDLLFELFDEAMLAEFQAAERQKPKQPAKKRAAPASKAPIVPVAPTPPPVLVQLYTHDRMELNGGVYAFNRYMDKWSLYACVDSDDVKLDGVPVDLTLPPRLDKTELLVKLHDPRPQWNQRKKR